MRLFHRENECYVTAEGSFANDRGIVHGENECCITPEGDFAEDERELGKLLLAENTSDVLPDGLHDDNGDIGTYKSCVY